MARGTSYRSSHDVVCSLYAMTEKEIKMLGFEKNYVSKEESGSNAYHYYTLDIANGLSFISSSSDEGDKWSIRFFNTEPEIVIDDFANAQKLINEICRYKT